MSYLAYQYHGKAKWTTKILLYLLIYYVVYFYLNMDSTPENSEYGKTIHIVVFQSS